MWISNTPEDAIFRGVPVPSYVARLPQRLPTTDRNRAAGNKSTRLRKTWMGE